MPLSFWTRTCRPSFVPSFMAIGFSFGAFMSSSLLIDDLGPRTTAPDSSSFTCIDSYRAMCLWAASEADGTFLTNLSSVFFATSSALDALVLLVEAEPLAVDRPKNARSLRPYLVVLDSSLILLLMSAIRSASLSAWSAVDSTVLLVSVVWKLLVCPRFSLSRTELSRSLDGAAGACCSDDEDPWPVVGVVCFAFVVSGESVDE